MKNKTEIMKRFYSGENPENLALEVMVDIRGTLVEIAKHLAPTVDGKSIFPDPKNL